MTVKDASNIIMAHRPDKVIIDCWEFQDFYAFALTENGRENEWYLGGYWTVGKADGAIGDLSPVDDWDALSVTRQIDIAELL